MSCRDFRHMTLRRVIITMSANQSQKRMIRMLRIIWAISAASFWHSIQAQPPQPSSDHWSFEFGSASLFRQSPWENSSGDAISVPTVAAKKGNWRLGMDYGLVSYQQQWQLEPIRLALNSGIGLRDETINSSIWGDSNDHTLKKFDDGGAEITFNLSSQIQWRALSASLIAEQDISGVSDGLTLTSQLALPLYQSDEQFAVKAQWFVGGRWLDNHYSNHLFGVSVQQANADFPQYRADSAFNPQFGVQLIWPINPQWLMRLRWHHEQLASQLQKSPLVRRNSTQMAALTFSYLL